MVTIPVCLKKGYTVTRARLRQVSAIKVTVFMCCYAVAYAALFIYEQVSQPRHLKARQKISNLQVSYESMEQKYCSKLPWEF